MKDNGVDKVMAIFDSVVGTSFFFGVDVTDYNLRYKNSPIMVTYVFDLPKLAQSFDEVDDDDE